MSQIKTTDPLEHGKSRATGLLGRIEFDKDGYHEIAEGKEDDARKLCTISQTLTFVEKIEKSKETKSVSKKKEDPDSDTKSKEKAAPTNTEPTITKTDEELKAELSQESDPIKDEEKIVDNESAATEVKNLSSDEKQALKEILDEKSMDQLREICKDSKDADENLWSKFAGIKGKSSLIDYILEKNLISVD